MASRSRRRVRAWCAPRRDRRAGDRRGSPRIMSVGFTTTAMCPRATPAVAVGAAAGRPRSCLRTRVHDGTTAALFHLTNWPDAYATFVSPCEQTGCYLATVGLRRETDSP